MALSAEELLEIKKALDTPGAIKDETYRTWALEQVASAEDEHLQGYAAAGGTRADSAPVATDKTGAPGSLGVKGIIGQESTPDEAEALAGQLDPRFDLIPQALAVQPATTHPGGDAAAAADAAAGRTGQVKYAYEPPVTAVQKMLVENPAFLRMIRSEPPPLEEIANMNATSGLYKDASNWLWRKTAEEAAKSGQTVYRYSQLPWLWGEDATAGATGGKTPEASGGGVLDQLRLKLGGTGQPLVDASNAFVMGVDDTSVLGAGRAAQETAQPETQMHVGEGSDYMGINEKTPQATKDLNQWTIEQNPLAYGGGQLLGTLWGAPARLFDGVTKGGRFVADAVAKTRLGAYAGRSGLVRAAGRAATDAVGGGVAAGAEELGRQGVDLAAEAAQTGQAPSLDRLAEAGERVKDVGESGTAWAGGGSLVASGSRGGAEFIRDTDRFQGKVRRTEPNLEWGLSTTLTGPRLSGETKELVKRANREGVQAGDMLAEEIAPAIRDKAAENTRRAEGRAAAERSNYYQTDEGRATAPMTRLQEQSLEELRRRHQPSDKGLHPVDEKYRPAQKVFNSLVEDVSTAPIEGGVKLTPDEAASFLGPRQRYQLLKGDIEAMGAKRAAAGPEPTLQRDAYLQTIKDSRARAAADEEIEASIEDIVGDRTPSPAARAKAEQTVLRELVEEASFVEAHGTLGDYLKQRGIDAVYVKPRAYDPKRTDALIDDLGEGPLAEAAKLDREGHTAGGERGGYTRMRRQQDEAIGKARRIEERVAPGGDAFKPVASLGTSRTGEKQLLDDTKALAEQAGVRDQLDKLRGLQDTQEIARRAWFRGRSGQNKELFNTQNIVDTGLLHSFPVLRALEGPLGPLGAGKAGRLGVLGQEPRVMPDDSARAKYEAARERRLKELAVEKNEEKERREKRRQRRAAGR